MKDEVFHNISWTVIRIFLIIGSVFAAGGLVPLCILWWLKSRGHVTPETQNSFLLAAYLAFPFAGAMFLSVLLTISTARQTDREFAQFRTGDLLASWEYPQDFWKPYIEAQLSAYHKVAWVTYGLIFGPFAVVALIVGFSVVSQTGAILKFCAIFVAALLGASLLFFWIARCIIRHAERLMVTCPRAYISATAVYCAGMFNFWGSQLRALQSIRLISGHGPGHPELLEFMIGYSTGMKKAAMAIDAVSMLALRPAMVSSMVVRQVVPVAPANETEAREIIRRLSPPTVAVTHHAPSPALRESAASHPAPLPGVKASPHKAPALVAVHHEPAYFARSARRWLIITVCLLLGGLGLFLVAIAIDPGKTNEKSPPAIVTFLDVLALFAWVLSPVTIILCVVQWIRSRKTK